MLLIFDVAKISHTGPRSKNEDTIGVWEFGEGNLAVAVADGLGGMGGGAQASNLAVSYLKGELEKSDGSKPNLVSIAEKAHSIILKEQTLSNENSSMATTLTAIVFSQSKIFGVHCGDTRASIAREKGIKKLTIEHSEGERLFRAGKLTKEEFLNYPRRNILDSALGTPELPRIDEFNFDLKVGDKVFLTSDGIHEKVFLREMQIISTKHTNAKAFVQEVNDLVVGRGPKDNYSMIAVFVS